MIKLYAHQRKNVEGLRSFLKQGIKSVLFQAPTGYGKTVVMAYIVQSALAKGSTIAIVLPRKELIRQTAKTLDAFDIPYTYVAAGRPYNPYGKVMLCSLQSFGRRIGKIKQDPDVIMIDETHFATSMLDKVVNYYGQKGKVFIGFSATPWRSDGKGLGCFYDEMVKAPQVADLIDMGYLSDYKLYAPSTVDTSGIKMTAGDFNKKELDELMNTSRYIVGDAVKYYGQLAHGKRAICYCVSVKHAMTCAEIFRQSGISAAAIHGGMGDAERKYIINSFADNDIMVLMNVDLLTFGFDLASQVGRDVTIEAMIDLRPTQSLSLQLQKWGRALRKKDNPAIIIDHAGNADTHGIPCEHRDWTLEDRPRKRKSEGGAINQCEECFFVYPKTDKHCPECGAVKEVKGGGGDRDLKEVDGELQEVLISRQRDMLKQAQEQEECQTLDELIEYFKAKGHKNYTMLAAQTMSIRMHNKKATQNNVL